MSDAPATPGRPPRVLVAGGFTGGHLFTAVAIAEAVRRRAPGAEVRLGAARGGMEVDLGRAAGLPVETVWLDGIARGGGARALARNAALSLELVVALAQARRVLGRFRPDVVVGVGAYVSFPFVAAASWRHVPTVLHEANAVPGVANGLLARRADVVCVGLGDAVPRFEQGGRRGWWLGPGPRRVVETGTPVRPEVARARDLSPEGARAQLGLAPSKQTVLVMGGSLGSSALNAWMLDEGASVVLAAGDRQILWQCGRAHLAACRARLGEALGVHLVPFLDDMAGAYAAADLVVAGAGAGTLAELAALGKPAVIVPDRAVSEDHQLHNAASVGRAGVEVWGAAADGGVAAGLGERIRTLVTDPARLRESGAAMARLARPHAADHVAAEVLALAARHAGG